MTSCYFGAFFTPPPPPLSCFFMHPSTLLVMRTRTPPPPLRHDVIYGWPQRPIVIEWCLVGLPIYHKLPKPAQTFMTLTNSTSCLCFAHLCIFHRNFEIHPCVPHKSAKGLVKIEPFISKFLYRVWSAISIAISNPSPHMP